MQIHIGCDSAPRRHTRGHVVWKREIKLKLKNGENGPDERKNVIKENAWREDESERRLSCGPLGDSSVIMHHFT